MTDDAAFNDSPYGGFHESYNSNNNNHNNSSSNSLDLWQVRRIDSPCGAMRSSIRRRSRGNSVSFGSGISFADSVQVIDPDNSIRELPLTPPKSAEKSLGSSRASSSEMNGSLTLDDLQTPDMCEDFKDEDSDSSVKSDDSPDIAKNIFVSIAQGYMVPAVFFIGGMIAKFVCCRSKDETDLVGPPLDSAAKRDLMQQSTQQALEASSRQCLGGVYIPNDPVSQQVLRQAAISAARSASLSAGQGATALATSAAATAAGTAASTKLLVAGLLVGLFATGAAITSGIVFLRRDALEDNPSRNNGWGGGGLFLNATNGTGSGGAGGSEQSNQTDSGKLHTCPPGQVLIVIDSIPHCVSAVGICDGWQEALEGECVDCPNGYVSTVDVELNRFTHTGCSVCPPGTVRSNANGSGSGSCVPATDHCKPWEYAIDGRCQTCENGQISAMNSRRAPTHMECESCPLGQVRSSADGSALGPCVFATGFCKSWQYAVNGKCTDCDQGKESPLHRQCTFCEPGLVRSSADGSASGPCVSAEGFCAPWQFAVNGRCTNCPNGQEASRDTETKLFTYKYCSFCEDGQVRSSRDGDAQGPCVSAVGICESFERATRGQCQVCPFGQTSSISTSLEIDHKSCFHCPDGQVRSSADGVAEGPCVPAQGYCQEWEWAHLGRCNTCSRGQVSAKDENGNLTYTGCDFCPAGQVRGDAGGRFQGPCVPAAGICLATERANKGVCVNCIVGQISSTDSEGRYNHLTCV